MAQDEPHKFKLVKRLVKSNPEKKIIIFCETKATVKQFANLRYSRFMTLHGDMDQAERLRTIARFRDPKCTSVLVATDVAARGLDIDDIDIVV